MLCNWAISSSPESVTHPGGSQGCGHTCTRAPEFELQHGGRVAGVGAGGGCSGVTGLLVPTTAPLVITEIKEQEGGGPHCYSIEISTSFAQPVQLHGNCSLFSLTRGRCVFSACINYRGDTLNCCRTL